MGAKLRLGGRWPASGIPILFGLVALAIVGVEGFRLLSVFSRVERAANWGLRYAVTGEFNPEYCPDPCKRGSQEHTEAVLESIEDAARAGFIGPGRRDLASTPDMSDLALVICSDAEHTVYVEKPPSCLPQEYPSEPGATVVVHVSYPYTIGSSFGLGLLPLRLEATERGQVECHRIGCISYLRVRLLGPVPDRFTIEARSSDGYYRLVECDQGKTIRSQGFLSESHARCRIDGATLEHYDPSWVEITVSWPNGTVRESKPPIYRVFRPNGYRCLPTCLWGTIEVELH